jgi:hypothetical protein
MSLGDIPKIPAKYKPRIAKLFQKIKAGEISLEEVGKTVLTATGKVTLDAHGLTIAGEYGRFEIDQRLFDDMEESMLTMLDALPVLLRKKAFLIKKGLEITKLTMGPTGIWRTLPKPADLQDKTLPIVEIVGDPKERQRKKVMNMFNHYLQAPLEEWEEVPVAIKVHRLEEIGTWMGNDWKTAGTMAKAMVPFVRITTKEIMDKLGVTFGPFCDHVLKKCGV